MWKERDSDKEEEEEEVEDVGLTMDETLGRATRTSKHETQSTSLEDG